MKNTIKTLAIIAALTGGMTVGAQGIIPVSISVGTSGKDYFEVSDSHNKCNGRAYPGVNKICTYTPEEFKTLTISLQEMRESGGNVEKVGAECKFGNPEPMSQKNMLGGMCTTTKGAATINNNSSPLAINLP